MRRFRWRLARFIAPEPIMADPHPGDATFVVQRTGETTMTIQLATLDVTSEIKRPFEPAPDERVVFSRMRHVVTIKGTSVS